MHIDRSVSRCLGFRYNSDYFATPEWSKLSRHTCTTHVYCLALCLPSAGSKLVQDCANSRKRPCQSTTLRPVCVINGQLNTHSTPQQWLSLHSRSCAQDAPLLDRRPANADIGGGEAHLTHASPPRTPWHRFANALKVRLHQCFVFSRITWYTTPQIIHFII